VLLFLALCLSGCPKEERLDVQNDRAIAQLRAEQERLARGGAPVAQPRPPQRTPESELAEAAAAPKPPRPLTILASQGSFGELTLALKSAEVSRNVQGAKTAVSTPDRFLRLVLSVRARGRDGLALGTATLSRQGETASVARDVQRVGQGSPLEPVALEAGSDQELVVYFEVPASMLAPGLKLVFTAADRTLELPVL
jgi:hypothetical protein